ncbi:Uncharacterized protein TCM_012540 [Theobroma cacao]|uniref:DUF4283 domain-containing protein n=1 Tax=Theobroma cacao TaxID=3641 RepID=A0A061FVT9_THECC|nr:Uncharacterized protein TCM_012540 [Theobroma cacao]
MVRWVSVTQKVEGRKTYAQALMGESETERSKNLQKEKIAGCSRAECESVVDEENYTAWNSVLSKLALSKAMKESRGAWLEEWFDYVKEWLEEFTYTSRQTWIASYGVPLHAWNVFMNAMQIVTKEKMKIKGVIKLRVGNRFYDIQVLEVTQSINGGLKVREKLVLEEGTWQLIKDVTAPVILLKKAVKGCRKGGLHS